MNEIHKQKYEFIDKNNIKENFQKNLSNNNFKLKPFYLMTLEDNDGDTKQIKIYKNSDPYELAYNFCKENNLDFESMKYIKRNIKNIIKKFEEKDFYFLNNNSIYEEEDEDNYEIGESYQNINGNSKDNDSQNKLNNNKMINLIKNKVKNIQLKINKIPPKQTKINEQIKKVVKPNSVNSPSSKKKNLINISNNNLDKNIQKRNEALSDSNLYNTINNLSNNKLNELIVSPEYLSTTDRNLQLENLSPINLQNSLGSFENGVPELNNQKKINIKTDEKNKTKSQEELNLNLSIKNNEKNEIKEKEKKIEEEYKYEKTPDKFKDKEKLILKNLIEVDRDSKILKNSKNNNNNNHYFNINKITNINNNNFNCHTDNKNNININNNIFSNKICLTSNNKNPLNFINRNTFNDINNYNYKLINLRKHKDKNNKRISKDMTNIKSYRNNDYNQQDTMLFLTEYKNIINILKGFKKNLKSNNKTISKENNKNENKSYINKIIKKLVNQYRNERSYEKSKKTNQIQKQMKNPNKLRKRKNIQIYHFSPQEKLNRYIIFSNSKKNSKSKDKNKNFYENNKSLKNLSNCESSQYEKEIISSDINNQNLSNTSRYKNKKVKENKSFNESRFFKKNKIKSKILNKNIASSKAYNQKYKNNKNINKKNNYNITICNPKKIIDDKFTHYGSCNFRPLSKDFINGYLEGLKSKFSALIYSPIKEDKNPNKNIIFTNQKSNYMFYEQKFYKNSSMTQKYFKNLKDLSDNKIKNNFKKELIIYNNNNPKTNLRINHSSLNKYNKSINYKSLQISKEKKKNSSLINDYLNKNKTNSVEFLSDMFSKLYFYLKHEKQKEIIIYKNYYLEKLKMFPKDISKTLNKMVNYLFNNYIGKHIDKNNFINEMGNIYNTILSKNEKIIISFNKNEIIQMIKQKKFQNSGRYKSIYLLPRGAISPLSLNNIKTITNKEKKQTKGIFNTISIGNEKA